MIAVPIGQQTIAEKSGAIVEMRDVLPNPVPFRDFAVVALHSRRRNSRQRPAPHADGKPVEVRVGFYIANLAALDQASESYDIAGYLRAMWKDPRLVYQGEAASEKELDPKTIWTPALEIVNVKGTQTTDGAIAFITPDGTVRWELRIGTTISSDLNLHRFPFDRQVLRLVIESSKYSETALQLIADEEMSGINGDSFVSLSEWPLPKQLRTEPGRSYFAPEKVHYSRASFLIDVDRESGFYIWKVILPVLLICMCSWTVFWIDLKEFATQVTIAVTDLLTIVAFLFVVNDSLPRVSYLTLMDRFTLVCLVCILATIVELVLCQQ